MHILTSLKSTLWFALIFAWPALTFAGTTYTVNVLTDVATGAGTSGSLRYCITTANITAGATAAAPHIIQFAAGGTGTITLTSNLPALATPIFIDGSTATGYSFWNPKVRLVGFSMLLNNASGSDSHLKGIVLSNGSPHAVDINGVNNLMIEECFIGTDLAGAADEGTANHGILVQLNSGLTIKNCIVSGHGAHGILAINSTNLTVMGCHIGLNKAGTAAIANGAFGILLLDASNNAKIGGLAGGTTDSMNVISGNGQVAIGLQGSAKSNIRVIRNYIGVNKAGSAALGNQFGINDAGSVTNFLVQGNVVSASTAQGMYFLNTVSLVIKGNYLGVDATGMFSIPNGSNSLDLNGANGAIIGGSAAADANVSSGTGGPGQHGIVLQGGSRTNNCIIKGNYIGTNKNGQAITGVGNQGYGIVIKGTNNIVGGTAAGEANIISGNKQMGVLLTDGDGNQVIGNLIGVAKDLTALGNGYGGIVVRREGDPSFPSSKNDIIRNNTIAYNGFTYPTNPTNATWVAPGKGPGIGISVAEYGTSNTDAIQNLIKDNSIYCNAGKGINLNKLEPTGYGNINKASPTVNVASTATNTFGTAAAGDVIQVFANPTACGCQGEVLLGTVTADGSGNWSLAHASSNFMTNTATARDAVNNTSEFSVCRDPTLPVDFVDFRAYPKTEGVAGLEWKVALEINNDHFTIEKSTDGIHFFSIGTVHGAGNSNAAKTYTYSDDNFTTNAYYRIKQTDFDGKSSYTRTRFLEINNAGKLVLYPNPASNELNISWQLPANSEVSVVLINTLSQVVSTQRYSTNDGFFEERIDLSTLPAGVYIVSVVSANQSASAKIIKQ
ncbi:MAG: hypothetical protein JWM14_2505 [Chitinophagaceae bacterium]|nr:hypothetical protein [Chitinophagaceae bacterium]